MKVTIRPDEGLYPKLAFSGRKWYDAALNQQREMTMTAPQNPPVDPDEALKRLMDGNARYAETKPMHPHQTAKHRKHLVDGQHPFAAILSCSDSRVPSELIFDRGFGDLFVIRVAGNVADPITIGSVEFAAAQLKVPLVMVMGHSSCGAVAAAVNKPELTGALAQLVAHIHPAVEEAQQEPGDLLENSVRAHARLTAQKLLAESAVLQQIHERQQLKIVASAYNLETGVVELL